MKHKKTKRPFAADVLLLAGIALVGGVLALFLLLNRRQGAVVEVRVTGQPTRTYPLDTDAIVEIEGADGGHDEMTISGGEVWMSEADCPDGLCMGMGKISANGESIVCLPNKIVLEISDGNAENSVDAVTGGQVP